MSSKTVMTGGHCAACGLFGTGTGRRLRLVVSAGLELDLLALQHTWRTRCTRMVAADARLNDSASKVASVTI